MSDTFEPKLGRIGWKRDARPERYLNKVTRAFHSAGHGRARSGSRFSGKILGRGSAFGTLAAASLHPGGQRRAIVKARITRFRAGNMGAARAHLRYIQRDGVTPDGEPGQLYDRDSDRMDGNAFLSQCEDDRHQFRLIVSPEDGAELADLKPFIRDLMAKAEKDLGTRLDWVAVNHHNTDNPHTHIVIRGKDDRSGDLIITRDYVSHGFRQRARELLTLELGPELEYDTALKLAREVEAERFTRLDQALLKHTDRGLLAVSAMPVQDRQAHASHMGRLKKLELLGLAHERQTGVWQIDDGLERKLRSLGTRGDIIKTMHRVVRDARIDRPAGSFAFYDPAKANHRIVGRVAGVGLSDEISDRHFVVIDGIDGQVHYADIGHVRAGSIPDKGVIVAIETATSREDDKLRTRLRILSYLNFEKLVEAEGPTWLDQELLAKSPEHITDQGFGIEARAALARRRQWLIAQGLAQIATGGQFQPRPRLIDTLRIREYELATQSLARELGQAHHAPIEGEQFSGIYVRPVNLASRKYAIIQKAQEFTLVPWRPEMEAMRGKSISGTASAQGIQWEWGPRRGLGI